MKRKLWLDYTRAFACILVSLGHLLLSLHGSGIFISGTATSFFVQATYRFHVQVFFFCSGFLFQNKFSQYDSCKKRIVDKLTRWADFVIVYVVFTAVTYFMKSLLSDTVNEPNAYSFWQVLLQHPINQMWYIYAVSMILLCTPVLRSKGSCWGMLLLTGGMRLLMCHDAVAGIVPQPLGYLLQNQVWFVLGAVWHYQKVELKPWFSVSLAIFFAIASWVAYSRFMDHGILNFALTLSGVLATVELIRWATKKKTKMSFVWVYISRYMLQIYLLHTICAAGIRIILLKMGIVNFGVHLVMGLVFSFAVPILCAQIAERTKILNVFFFPIKTIKQLEK